MPPLSYFAPAKLNLHLAVTGRRPDGFHDLVSLVAPLEFGDTLEAELAAETTLVCDDPGVPGDARNLVLRAAEAFASATGRGGGVRFRLQKRIPMGAGLGGGSSDAVAALRALNELHGRPLDRQAMAGLAADLGSDCPLFLEDGPCIVRGRGERVEPLPAAAVRRLRGRRVLVFKPGFGVPTPWAYAQLAAANAGPRGPVYLRATDADARLAAWIADEAAPAEAVLFNHFERVVFAKYLALPELVLDMQRRHGVTAVMSGSGSACFALLEEAMPAAPLADAIRAAWGTSSFVVETRLA